MSKEKEMLKTILANTNAIMKHLGISAEVADKKRNDKAKIKSESKSGAISKASPSKKTSPTK